MISSGFHLIYSALNTKICFSEDQIGNTQVHNESINASSGTGTLGCSKIGGRPPIPGSPDPGIGGGPPILLQPRVLVPRRETAMVPVMIRR